MKFNEDGWLFKNNSKNEINEKKINDLLELAIEEDNWQKRVRDEVEHRDILTMNRENPIIDEIRMRNTKGTIVPLPFGIRVLTFNSTRHFYRGENELFPRSVPSLNRKIDNLNEKNKELYRAISNLRIKQFIKFIWKFNIIPLWEAKLSDINYKALAQHYGLETSLLDLTNNLRVALFFATCKYVPETDSYRPLTKEDIEKNENTKYGVIYHSPNWMLDYFGVYASLNLMERFKPGENNKTYEIDSGMFDDIAFQIGYQPFMRCEQQSSYVFPMRNSNPLGDNSKFEKLYFRHSPELSQRIFEMMDNGKKVFPEEGISKAKKYIDDIKNAAIFTKEDVNEVYELEVDKKIFPTIELFENELTNFEINGEKVKITDKIEIKIEDDLLNSINSNYDNKDLLKPLGGKIFLKPEDKEYFRKKSIYIFGKEN